MTTSPPSPPPPGAALAFTARGPEDLLAAAAVVLGFHPDESVVMLTFGGPTPFHARLDLPVDAADTSAAVRALVAPAVRHRVEVAAFVLYADDRCATRARRTARELLRQFPAAGVGVLDVVRADGARWFTLDPARRGVPGRGVPYDLSSHPFVAEAVFSGRPLHRSRAELAATLRPDPAGVAAMAAALATASPLAPDEVRAAVDDALAAGRVADDVLARLLLGMDCDDARELVWRGLDRSTARDHVRLWSDAVRRSPDEVLTLSASALGLAAWVAGDGALGRCALDRCEEAGGDHPLAALVEDLLERAVPPTVWAEVRDAVLGGG